MKRVKISAPPILASAIILGLSITPPTLGAIIEDWSSGTDDAWTRADLLELYGLGGTSYTVSDNHYTIASNTSLPALDVIAGSASMFTDSLLDPAKYANGELTTSFTINNATSDAFVPMRGDLGTLSFVSFYASTEYEEVGVSIFVGLELQTNAFFAMDVLEGQEYYLKAGAVGNQYTIKVWPVGNSEPDAWQATLIDDTFTEGAIGLGIDNHFNTEGPLSVTYGAIDFVPEPATAFLLLAAFGVMARRRG